MSHSRIFLSPPHMSGNEMERIRDAFSMNYIAPAGPQLEAFERAFCEYTGIAHAVAVCSGTAAMHLALRELGITAGDEVVVSSLTFIGSVSPVTFLGATPVFIDADPATWNIDSSLLESEIKECAARNKLPRAVIAVDLYGQCSDLDRIRETCGPYGIPVVVDAAESMGAKYKGRHAGKGAEAAVYSFNGNKIITTSGGGMLASEDGRLVEHARHLSTQARDPAPHYEHSEIGYNYRMSNVVAAIGLGQLAVLDERVRARRRIFDFYASALGDEPGISFMPEAPHTRANRWLSVMLVDEEEFGSGPEAIRLALERHDIESRPLWKPMHLQPVFRGCRVRGGAVAESLFRRGLCLPSGTALSDEDLDRISGIIRGLRG